MVGPSEAVPEAVVVAAHRIWKPAGGLWWGSPRNARKRIRRLEVALSLAKGFERGALQPDAVVSDRHVDGGLDRALLTVSDYGERGQWEHRLDPVGSPVDKGLVQNEQSARGDGEPAAGPGHGDNESDHDDTGEEHDAGLDGDPDTDQKIRPDYQSHRLGHPELCRPGPVGDDGPVGLADGLSLGQVPPPTPGVLPFRLRPFLTIGREVAPLERFRR